MHVELDLARGFDTEDQATAQATVEEEWLAGIASPVVFDSTLLPGWDRSCMVRLFMAEQLIEGHCTLEVAAIAMGPPPIEPEPDCSHFHARL